MYRLSYNVLIKLCQMGTCVSCGYETAWNDNTRGLRRVHAGNVVVKRTKRRFNQVPADQATEWINKTCQMQNGIIGITRNDQTRDKFCVTWAERSRISKDTRYLFNLEDEEEETTFTRSDSLPSQMKRDADDVKKLITQLTRLDVFRVTTALREEEDGDMDSLSGDSQWSPKSWRTGETACYHQPEATPNWENCGVSWCA